VTGIVLTSASAAQRADSLPQVDAAVASARDENVSVLRQVARGPHGRLVRALHQRLVAGLGVVTARQEWVEAA
jgi:hypothetical protein